MLKTQEQLNIAQDENNKLKEQLADNQNELSQVKEQLANNENDLSRTKEQPKPVDDQGAINFFKGLFKPKTATTPQNTDVQQTQPIAQPATVDTTAPADQHIPVEKIAQWSKVGVVSQVIIDRIKASHSTYFLTERDIDYLHQNNVSEEVIQAMRKTE